MREWLNAQAAGGFVDVRPRQRALHAAARADGRADRRDEPRLPAGVLPDRARLGDRLPEDHRERRAAATGSAGTSTSTTCTRAASGSSGRATTRTWCASGCRRSTASWSKLERGALVADVGCGHGASTILMAQAFPNSTFVGSDYHDGVDRDGAPAGRGSGGRRPRQLRNRPRGGVQWHRLRPRDDVRLPARHGRSGRRRAPCALDAQAGRHLDDRRAERRRPRRGQPQPGRPRVLRVLDAAVHAGVAVPGGRAGARRAGGRGPDPRRRPDRRLHPLPPRRPRRRSTSYSRRVRDGTVRRRPWCPRASRAPPRAEQTRARYPDQTGYIERDGVRVFYEVYGSGEPTSCCFRRGRSSTRGSGRRRSHTWRVTSGS